MKRFQFLLAAIGFLLIVGTAGAQDDAAVAPTCGGVALEQQAEMRLESWEIDCVVEDTDSGEVHVERCPTLVVYQPAFLQPVELPGCGQEAGAYQLLPITEERYTCDATAGCVLLSTQVIDHVQDWATVPCS